MIMAPRVRPFPGADSRRKQFYRDDLARIVLASGGGGGEICFKVRPLVCSGWARARASWRAEFISGRALRALDGLGPDLRGLSDSHSDGVV